MGAYSMNKYKSNEIILTKMEYSTESDSSEESMQTESSEESMQKESSEDYNIQEASTINTLSNPSLANQLSKYLDTNVMIVLKANQLNILNQVFRPIMVGKLKQITDEYAVFEKVNIKMNQAPEYIFPTPLIIPLIQIAWYLPFEPNVRISLY